MPQPISKAEALNREECTSPPRDLDEDPELDKLIADFPSQTADFLLNLRNQHELAQLKTTAGKTRALADTKNRVIAPQKEQDSPFYSETTYQKFFGKHDQESTDNEATNHPPVLRFGEMPVFTDSILYPTQQRRLQSTTHEAFVPKQIILTEIARPMQNSLKVEGERNFETTNRSTYTQKPLETNAARRKKHAPKEDQWDMKSRSHQPFMDETQFRRDFPPERAWSSVNPTSPCAPLPVVPPRSEITLRDNNEWHFRTEQRDRFPGHDPRAGIIIRIKTSPMEVGQALSTLRNANPVPKPFRRENPPYERPSIKFADTTVTKSDFLQYSPSEILAVNQKAPSLKTEVKKELELSELSEAESKLLKDYLKKLNVSKGTKLPKS